MSAIQKDLPLFLVKSDHPNVDLLVRTLTTHGDWLSAAQILERWQTPDTDHNRRFVRALAEAAAPEVISGQLGYKWIGHASPDESSHAAAWLESQAVKMSNRACAIRRRAHQLIGRQGQGASGVPPEVPSAGKMPAAPLPDYAI